MPRRMTLTLLAGLVLFGGLPAQEKQRPAYRTKDEAIKLFVGEFVLVAPGKDKVPEEFVMGSDADATEKPAHKVKLSRPFHVAKYEVTQELYQAVMGNNPAKWKGPRNSVEVVSWKDANEFCRKATAELRKAKLIGGDEEVRLPTEAEWEFCCRAGTTTPYSFGDVKDIRDYCWYKVNAPGNDPPVGAKKPNSWGLHEMHGYVAEWCLDSWFPDYKDAPADGSARVKKGGKEYVVRGGAFNSEADRCRSAAREGKDADFKSDALGFRCVKAKVK